jgi:hypothetical protein
MNFINIKKQKSNITSFLHSSKIRLGKEEKLIFNERSMFGYDISYDIDIPLDPLKFTRE